MAQKMKLYIEEQPAVWSHIMSSWDSLVKPAMKNLSAGHASAILLIGTGSSLNASQAAKDFFEELVGVETKVIVPTRMGKCFTPPESTLIFAVSQSGKSTSTAAAVGELMEQGYQVIGVSSDMGSPLAKQCSSHITIDCKEEEVGPKTKGMTATILTLYMIALTAAQIWGRKQDHEIEEYIYHLKKAIEFGNDNIKTCYKFSRIHMKQWVTHPHFTWVSDGIGYPVASESALKVLETLYVPAFAYEFEEYLHGVNNTIEPGECYFWMPSTEENRERMERIYEFCSRKRCACYLITTLETKADDERTLRLNGTGKWYTQPFETLFFSQVLSALGSEEKGIDCDKPKFPEFYQLMNTKL